MKLIDVLRAFEAGDDPDIVRVCHPSFEPESGLNLDDVHQAWRALRFIPPQTWQRVQMALRHIQADKEKA